MAGGKINTNKLSVYMIKPEFQRLEDIIDSTEEPTEIPGVGHFVFEESHPHQPDWVKGFFGSALDDDVRIFASSAKGLFLVPVTEDGKTVFFALSFGVGRHLLKDGVVEERFGLKVVLNSVDLASFRSIDKTTLGSVPKHSREQMGRDVAPTDFGIDIEQDLISSVTGKSRDERLGKIITGKDVLSLSVPVDTTNVVEFLLHSLKRYQSTDYKINFDWIDQIADVRDKRIEEELNTILIDKINRSELDKIWMAVPEVLDWSNVKGFRYLRAKRADVNDDVDMSTYLASLGGIALTADLFKEQPVFMISATTEEVGARWKAFRCTYAEIVLKDRLYILNNGKWYEIARGFTEEVQKDFANTAESTITLPDCTFSDEASYNEAAAGSISGACCMDGKLVMHGGGHSKIEFCDIYTSDKRLVHIKRYGNSSVLSHLFSQGVVSGELFVSDNEFRDKLNAELPTTHKIVDPSVRPNAPEHEIVYGIISHSEKQLDIPFFSKVSLRNAKRRLSSYGYKVTIKKITKSASPT